MKRSPDPTTWADERPQRQLPTRSVDTTLAMSGSGRRAQLVQRVLLPPIRRYSLI
jgi:hypothetical protein